MSQKSEPPLDDFAVEDNPFMAANTFDELQSMEAALYSQCWQDGKLIPGKEDYYNHQMALFEQALSSLFPEHYYHVQKNK